jgi:hypothetical protein
MEVVDFNQQTYSLRKIVLLFDYDLLKLIRSKSEQWIHLPSGRIYDVEICPPRKIIEFKGKKKKGQVDQREEEAQVQALAQAQADMTTTTSTSTYPSSCYVDDITLEPLMKVRVVVCVTFLYLLL